ncbi:NAD(P)-dependent alcohol dehydrogenase [Neisseria animalis]|uniref:NAD(P)-dependent alcohol dehydrogenase n=1 Tax=Neisseria animalis TaxID=492 RepID=A0A5P3MTU2_NEIAN|nr:NAD(P)-dependent alcohol dehydrogenase [Neisseria animalis]QEY24069.1 NAD(P)-dependent alcohol dehydrogenase [Neisseria animalis]ROW32635.1 NAD(P)-dependent alcohol dehydrogenase [Neisseria animalis]VEE06208.1 alcohol dehydrogenase [Neisseria animalis]
MTIPVKAYAAQSPSSPLAPFDFERRDLRDNDVEIDILYCGVCHSDLHTARADWGEAFSLYPVVPGHEIVGRVKSIGSAVSKYKVGDLVGVGCMVDSCQECPPCHHDLEQFCEQGMTGTYSSRDRIDGSITQGGYSTGIVVREEFVLRVPESLDTKAVAPLLCAGITTYSPLRHWNVKPGSKVAVIGLGGLGHMAIKLAKAMGAEVSLFTRSKGKEQDAYALGASRVIYSTDEAAMQAAANQFDLIIDTVPYTHDLKPYIPTLALDGTLVLVGLVGELEQTISTVPLLFGRRSIAASLIGGIKETQEMLDFCAEHNVLPEVEMIDMQNINEAYERMLKSDVKYRFVIDMESLKK